MDQIKSLIEDSDPLSSWWPFIIALVVGLIMTVRTIMGGQRCPTSNLIDKQIVIITGGNSGIGMELCKILSARSGNIIMACRDMEKAEKILNIIKREIKYGAAGIEDVHIESRYLDLRSFDSVRRFVKGIINDFDRIDILINNAGIIFYPNEKTVDGFEIHLQVNYLSGFLLTQLLRTHLEKSENGRIINISAHAHAAGKMTLEDPLNIGTWSQTFHSREAFAHSKLAIILATRHLAKIFKDTNVTVNACTPGLVRGTNHLKRSPIMSALCVKVMTYPWMWLFMKNPFEGAQCVVYLATDPKLKRISGEYFNDCEKTEPSELAKDDELAERLYEETMKVLKLK